MSKELKTLSDYILSISNNPLYRHFANGDNRLMAALCLFFSLSYQLDFANYAVKRVLRLQKNDNKDLTDDARDTIILYELQHAILAYSSCYDTIIQIVYFAFHFAKDFNNEKDYLKQLSRCKWYEEIIRQPKGSNLPISVKRGLRVWFEEIETAESKALFVKLSELYGPNYRGKVNKFANIIKHKGGISISSLNTYIPDISRITEPIKFVKRETRYYLDPQSKIGELFRAEIFYPTVIDIEDCIDMLIEQNHIICNFVEYLYTFMGLNKYNKEDLFAPKFELPFYYEHDGTKQDK